jgi:demethylmenaquinone methyltransferase/2-methoxy-6-polyprenyl-1,4-benzoquinol methylase
MTRNSFLAAIPMQTATSRKVYDASYVRYLFDSIAPRYDVLNHILSFGADIFWRKRTVAILSQFKPHRILDVATGTADLALAAAKKLQAQILGIDVSPEMLRIAKEKINTRGWSDRITLAEGTAESLPFPDSDFDAVMVAFGVRNFSNLEAGLGEMFRVLKQDGAAVILEFSKPRQSIFGSLFGLYFKRILPVVGGLISGNKDAYRYLPSTVGEFPAGIDFLEVLHRVGFSETIQYPLTFGIATIYIGIKR